MKQYEIDKLANEPTYMDGGGKKGCGFWLMWIIVLALIIGGALIAFSSGNLNLHV